MTKWLITITAHSAEDDSKVLQLMRSAGKLKLGYTVSSKEVEDKEPPRSGREGGLVK